MRMSYSRVRGIRAVARNCVGASAPRDKQQRMLGQHPTCEGGANDSELLVVIQMKRCSIEHLFI